MADNVIVTAGTGTTIAADEVTDATLGTAKVGYVKLMDGTLNGTEKIAGDAANGLDVDVTRVSGNVTVIQGTATNLKVDASGVPVPITDNSGSLTVDGTVTVTQTTATNLKVDASSVAVPITDNSSSLTVDAPVGSPVFTRLSDGTAALTTSSGRLSVDASGVAVPITDNSGSITVDGTVAATQSGSWTVTATNGSVGSTGSAVPSSATLVGGSDGTNLRAPRVHDSDTGAGTEYNLGVSLRKGGSGGSVELGTSSDPMRTDPTGTTTQPVSGTVTVQQSTASNLKVDLSGTSANATAINVSVANSSIPVTDNGGSLTVDGTVAATQSGTWNIGTVSSISGTVTADTELPAAVVLTDGLANPTTPQIGANNLLFNGTSWDRVRGDTTNGVDVDVTRMAALVAGTATIGNTVSTGSTDNSLGTSAFFNSALSTTVTNVKASSGNLYGYYIYNPNASTTYIQVFNSLAVNVVLGTTTPILSLGIPATSGANLALHVPIGFGTAISAACTTTATGAAAPSVGMTVNVMYK